MRLAGEKIESSETLKICGYNFGSRPGIGAQVDAMEKQFTTRAGALRHLKQAGLTKNDLKECYVSLVRPIFDFASVAYHSLLVTKEQGEKLERLQRRAISIITGESGGKWQNSVLSR